MRIRIDLKARNDILLSAIERKFGSNSALAKVVAPKIPATVSSIQCLIGDLVNLRPSNDHRRFGKRHLTLAQFLSFELGIPQDDILPPDLIDKQMPVLRARITTTMDIPALLEFQADSIRHALPSPADTLEQEDVKKNLATAIDTLTPREADVIRSRFGLDRPQETLEQIGARFKVRRERIRQIEMRALRKLQHPSRLQKLT